MKVFEINTVCGSGSTGRIAANLARLLQRNGDECCIAYARGDAPKDVNAWKFGSKLEIYWHGIMTRLTDRHGMYSRKATKNLIAKIKEYDPDIIHLHNLHGYYLNIELLFHFLKEYQKPIVWTLHDCWSYTGHCAYYSLAKCNKWESICMSCPQSRAYPGSLWTDNSRRNYCVKKDLFTSVKNIHLVVPSLWLKEEVKRSFFGQDIDCTVVPNGIDTQIFRPMQTGSHSIEGRKIILGVANIWDERKGMNDFISLFDVLGKEYQIVLIGLSERQAKILPDGIIGLPRTTNAENLAEWYSSADIYFNASVEETMGMTTAEAICCGTPVVVYNATAIPESVGKDCGIVVEAGNLDQVVHAIETIEHDYQRYADGCALYRENFRMSKADEAYYNIYETLLT
jgi:glycosyltransferase involved in cell wall biosynthesis